MNIVLLDAYLADNDNQDTWPHLENMGTITRYNRTTPEQTAERLKNATVAITNKVVINKDIISACPQLKHIAITATGTNVVDLAACREAGIAVSNVPAYSTESVAQHVFAFILARATDLTAHTTDVADGRWGNCPDFSFLTKRGNSPVSASRLLATATSAGCGASPAPLASSSTSYNYPGVMRKLVAGHCTKRWPMRYYSLHCPLTQKPAPW